MKNKELLLAVCLEIEPILDQLVLVGGCATELLITDEAAPSVRPTIDVDMVVKVTSLSEYYKLEEQLRALGFKQTQDDQGVICRWQKNKLLLDLMPTDEKILGFSNRWYELAVEFSESINMNGLIFHHITAPIFLATKIEAFKSRGESDYMLSHDLEDAISVIDGRADIIKEIQSSPDSVKQFLNEQFKCLLKNRKFEEVLPGYLPPDSAGQGRLDLLMAKLIKISKL